MITLYRWGYRGGGGGGKDGSNFIPTAATNPLELELDYKEKYSAHAI